MYVGNEIILYICIYWFLLLNTQLIENSTRIATLLATNYLQFLDEHSNYPINTVYSLAQNPTGRRTFRMKLQKNNRVIITISIIINNHSAIYQLSK